LVSKNYWISTAGSLTTSLSSPVAELERKEMLKAETTGFDL
jgi:hypothetical protein